MYDIMFIKYVRKENTQFLTMLNGFDVNKKVEVKENTRVKFIKKNHKCCLKVFMVNVHWIIQ